MTDRNYQVTFIVNLRQTKRKIEELAESVKTILSEQGAKVEKMEDLGLKDFAYVTDNQNSTGHYLRFWVSASGDFNAKLQEALRLDKEIKRAFVESVATSAKA